MNEIKNKKVATMIAATLRIHWCLGPESNRHDTKYRGILSPYSMPNSMLYDVCVSNIMLDFIAISY